MDGKKRKTKVEWQMSLTFQVFFLTFFGFFFSTMVNTLGTVIDGIIIGQTMKTADVSANTVTAPLWFFIAMIANLFAKGNQLICADKLSRGKVDEAKNNFSMTFFLSLGFGVLVTVVILIFRFFVTKLLGIGPEDASFIPCRQYLIGATLGIPGQVMLAMLAQGLHLEGARKWSILSVVVMTVTDVALDLFAVLVLHGGMFAMGLTTAISIYAGLLVEVYYFIRKDPLLKIVKPTFSFAVLWDMVKNGLPMAVSRFTTAWKSRFINTILAGTLTAAGLAAFHVQVQVNYIMNAVLMGVAQTLGVIVRIAFAEEDKRTIRKATVIAVLMVLFVGVLLYFVADLDAIPELLIRFYLGKNTEAYELANVALQFYFAGLLGQGLAIVLANYLQSTKRIWWANLIYVLDDVVFVYLSLSFWKIVVKLGKGTDLDLILSVFVGILLAQVAFVLIIPLIIVLVNHRRVSGWDALLMLPKDYGVGKDQELTDAPKTVEEAAAFAKDAYDFCIGHNLPQRKAYLISLAAEELIKNTITHGFSSGKNRIEVRLVVKNDEAVLRIRDNCGKFNPKQYYETVYENENKEENIGIRMVMEMAKDVSYTSTLKLNNICIRV